MNLHLDSVRYALVPRSTVLRRTVRKARVADAEETRQTNTSGGCNVIAVTSCARARLSVFAWRLHERSWAFSRVRVSISAVACTECSPARVSYPPALIRPPLALPLNFHESGVLAANRETEPRKSCNDNVGFAVCPRRRSAGTQGRSRRPDRHERRRSELSRVREELVSMTNRSREGAEGWTGATRTCRIRDSRRGCRGLVASRLIIVFCPRRLDLAGRGTYTNLKTWEIATAPPPLLRG